MSNHFSYLIIAFGSWNASTSHNDVPIGIRKTKIIIRFAEKVRQISTSLVSLIHLFFISSVYINNRLAFKTTSGPSLTALIEKQRNTPNSSELIKQLELIANLIERETVDGAQALNILQFCRDNIINFQNRVDIIECIWETLQEKQFELTVNHYAAIIQANQRIDHRPAIFRIYEEMNKNGLKPT